VFGNDRVRGTCEQRILQVELMRLRVGAGLFGDEKFYRHFLNVFGFSDL